MSQHSPSQTDQGSMVQILDAMNRGEPSILRVRCSQYITPVRKIKSRADSNQGDSSLDVIQIAAIEQRYNDNIDDTPNEMFKRR